MIKLCRKAGDRETGGILVGHYDGSLRTAVVARVSGAPRGSQHGAASFYRAVGHLQQLLDRLWSGGGGYYVGEWHYHPGGAPEFSQRDRTQMLEIARSREYSCPEPVLVIIGGDPNGAWRLSANVFLRSGEVIPLSCPE